jgi:hypothetical protein
MLEEEKRALEATLHEACSGGAHAAAMDGKRTRYDSAQSRRSHYV